MEEARASFYRISQCGYYRLRDPNAREFGSALQLLEDLQRWTRGRPLGQTATFRSSDGGIDPVYVVDVRGRDDSWLLTLWNETPSVEGQVASVVADSNVGNAQVVLNALAPGSIPGFATYFYVIPSESLAIGVKFQHTSFGRYPMSVYLQSFLEAFSRHVVHAPEESPGIDVAVLGYAEAAGIAPRRLKPRFTTKIYRKPGETEMLVANAERVTKLIRKTDLPLQVRDSRALWQKMLERAGMREPSRRPDAVRVQYQMEVELKAADVRQIIHTWEADADRTEWDDVGFVLSGEASRPHWLSSSVARQNLRLEVRRDNAEIVNAQSLHRELERHRGVLLQSLR